MFTCFKPQEGVKMIVTSDSHRSDTSCFCDKQQSTNTERIFQKKI